MDRTEQIRARAHQIWEGEGSPDGREADHWSEAERQLRAEGALADDDRPDDMGLEEVARKPGTAGIGGSDNWGSDLDDAQEASDLPDAQEVELIKPRVGRR